MKLRNLLTYMSGQFLGAGLGLLFSKLVYNIGDGPFNSLLEYSFEDIAVRFAGETLGKRLF